MAKQTGIFKVQGTVDDVTFYKSADGDLIRKKGGVSKSRIKSDPNFARTRENMSEFGRAGAASKLLRDNIRPLIVGVGDGKLTSRMLQLMMNVQRLDTTSLRGQRSVGVAQASAAAKQLFKNFNFNKDKPLASVLLKPISITASTATMTIDDLVPVNEIIYPVEASHVNISGVVLNVNFATGIVNVKYTNIETREISNTDGSVTLTPSAVPTGTGMRLYILKIEFAQMINGSNYPLRNGSFSAVAIIEAV